MGLLRHKANLHGEWWVYEDGSAQFADGDVGDLNHEAHVIEMARSEMGCSLECEWEQQVFKIAYDQFEYLKETLEEEVNNLDVSDEEFEERYREYENRVHELKRQAESDPEGFLSENYEQLPDFDFNLFIIANGNESSDIRKHAMKNWGWKRMVGNTIETYRLTSKDLDLIVSGIEDAYGDHLEEDLDSETFTLEVGASNMVFHGVPLHVLESKDISALSDYRSTYDMMAGGITASSLNWYKRAQTEDAVSTSSDQDAEYLEAVKSGDMDKAQRMVDEAAKKAGYDVIYHGTQGDYDAKELGESHGILSRGIYTSHIRDAAEIYAGEGGRILSILIPQQVKVLDLSDGERLLQYMFDNEIIKQDDLDVDTKEYILSGRPFQQDPFNRTGYMDDVVATADEQGYDIIKLIDDLGQVSDANYATVIANKSIIKVVEPVVYDGSGNIIPLSERFNSGSTDIYSSSLNWYKFAKKEEWLSEQGYPQEIIDLAMNISEKYAVWIAREKMNWHKSIAKWEKQNDWLQKNKKKDIGTLYHPLTNKPVSFNDRSKEEKIAFYDNIIDPVSSVHYSDLASRPGPSLSGELNAMPLMTPSEWRNIIDWAEAENPDIMKYSLYEAKNASDIWHQELAAAEEDESLTYKTHNVVYQFENGWQIVELSPEDCTAEGNKMGHCVGSSGYANLIERGGSLIYSLRDPKNEPHATIELDPQWGGEQDNKLQSVGLVQVQGKGNQEPIPEYKEMIREWFEKGMKEKDVVLNPVEPQVYEKIEVSNMHEYDLANEYGFDVIFYGIGGDEDTYYKNVMEAYDEGNDGSYYYQKKAEDALDNLIEYAYRFDELNMLETAQEMFQDRADRWFWESEIECHMENQMPEEVDEKDFIVEYQEDPRQPELVPVEGTTNQWFNQEAYDRAIKEYEEKEKAYEKELTENQEVFDPYVISNYLYKEIQKAKERKKKEEDLSKLVNSITSQTKSDRDLTNLTQEAKIRKETKLTDWYRLAKKKKKIKKKKKQRFEPELVDPVMRSMPY